MARCLSRQLAGVLLQLLIPPRQNCDDNSQAIFELNPAIQAAPFYDKQSQNRLPTAIAPSIVVRICVACCCNPESKANSKVVQQL